jgi:hypothetical protein
MTAVAQTPEVARPAARTGWDVAGACLAAAAFAVLCVLVLRAVPYLPEPDDYAYRASIVAMTDGHFFTLSGAQAHALAVQLAPQLGGSRLLYATYTWTAAPGLSTLQAARFYVPALGAISLLGAWLLARVPRRQRLAAITTLAVVAALFGLGSWAFHDMYQHPFGPQIAVVPGPGGTVELKPGPGAGIGRAGRMAPGGPGPAVRTGPSGGPGAGPAS